MSYLEDDLEMFDYMDDMRDISDSTLLEALLIWYIIIIFHSSPKQISTDVS